MPDSERIYTVREVCNLLGAPRVTVLRWIREGILLAFKFPNGRLWRIRKSYLIDFIEEGEKKYIE